MKSRLMVLSLIALFFVTAAPICGGKKRGELQTPAPTSETPMATVAEPVAAATVTPGPTAPEGH